MPSFVYKIYEDGTLKVYESGDILKIYDRIAERSCLKNLLYTVHITIENASYDSYLCIAPQDASNTIITITVLNNEWDKYNPQYTFEVSITDNDAMGAIDAAVITEEAFENLGCINRLNEVGPRYIGKGNQTSTTDYYEVLQQYKYICNVSEEA